MIPSHALLVLSFGLLKLLVIPSHALLVPSFGLLKLLGIPSHALLLPSFGPLKLLVMPGMHCWCLRFPAQVVSDTWHALLLVPSCSQVVSLSLTVNVAQSAPVVGDVRAVTWRSKPERLTTQRVLPVVQKDLNDKGRNVGVARLKVRG